jgi:hypothetical protein
MDYHLHQVTPIVSPNYYEPFPRSNERLQNGGQSGRFYLHGARFADGGQTEDGDGWVAGFTGSYSHCTCFCEGRLAYQMLT